jgi:hypothetical protein
MTVNFVKAMCQTLRILRPLLAFICTITKGELISLWLYKENNKLRD